MKDSDTEECHAETAVVRGERIKRIERRMADGGGY
jgi:hypothetical protein